MQEQPTEDAWQDGASGLQWRMRLLQVAGGDAAFAAKLRKMLWHAYRAKGCPCGLTEAGMFHWLVSERPESSCPPRKRVHYSPGSDRKRAQ